MFIEKIEDVWVVRDDLISGGTKRRALVQWLPTLGKRHFHYAGSVYGSGGWALAEACKELGYASTLHLAKSKYNPGWLDTIERVVWHDPQPVSDIYHSLLEVKDEACLLPLGFNDTEFKNALTEIIKSIDVSPSEIWMPCVSGTLLQSAQTAFPGTAFNAVCVARHHGDTGNAKLYYAAGKYHQPAPVLPPYPANIFSDAKLWPFVRQFALKDALIWNTSS